MKDHHKITPALLHYYFISGAIETLIVLGLLFSFDTDPKNIWLLGFSKARLGLGFVFLTIFSCFVWLALKSWRNDAWQKNIEIRLIRLIDTYGIFIPVFIIIYGITIFATYFYLSNADRSLAIHGILTRIYPFILLAISRSIQTIIVYVALWVYHQRNIHRTGSESKILIINRNKVTSLIGMTISFLALASFCVDIIFFFTNNNHLAGFYPKFFLSGEQNFPTYFSSFNLALAGLLLAIIAGVKNRVSDKYAYHWGLLGVIFIILSIDEFVGLHEWINDPMKQVVKPEGVFFYPWVVAVIPIILIFAAAYTRFLLHLPKKTRTMFITAGVVYIIGAWGFELFQGWYFYLHEEYTFFLFTVMTVEDIMEMLGILLFINALLYYIADSFKEINLRFT